LRHDRTDRHSSWEDNEEDTQQGYR
jgi:hypothetical protein